MLLPYVLFVFVFVGSYLLIKEFERRITGKLYQAGILVVISKFSSALF